MRTSLPRDGDWWQTVRRMAVKVGGELSGGCVMEVVWGKNAGDVGEEGSESEDGPGFVASPTRVPARKERPPECLANNSAVKKPEIPDIGERATACVSMASSPVSAQYMWYWKRTWLQCPACEIKCAGLLGLLGPLDPTYT